MGGHVVTNRVNDAGRGRMDGQHSARAKGQRLTAQHLVAGCHADLAFVSDMLFEWNNKTVR